MKDYLNLIMFILSLFSAGILACFIAYQSTLIQDIKEILGLDAEKDYSNYKWKSWFKPIMFLWLELRALINCPYCCSVWIGFFISYLLWDITIPFSFIYSMIAVFSVEIWRKLTL